MKRYYVADTWSDGATDFCYIVTISTAEGARVYVAEVYGEKYVLDDDVTDAVSNVVPIAEMFDCAYEVEVKQIFARVAREETMARKKEYEKAVLVRMTEEQHKKIAKIAEKKQTTIADAIRDYIKRAKCPK